ncbi:MAG: putative lipoprotein involved in nitrous oxide reduction [Rhodobacteraceae bacterium HLUCCA12]|nr:MAG: putative lipoprotein involved in nitrous oxide reduction [Rhodobacteraceae bacterium HLUCCA12]
MIRPALLALSVLALAACREDSAETLPDPVTMTAEAVGHFCQMNLLEHPGPKAQVHLDGMPWPLFFSQVRDAVAYQRMPEQSHLITAIYVSDMAAPGADWDDPGADNWITADDAHYVVGADVEGGMGAPELVPFSNRDAAEDFVNQHGGTVLALSDIADDDVLAPVEFDGDIGSGDDSDFDERLRALSNDLEG